MYAKQIDRAFYNKNLSGLYVTFSKEENKKKHVQNVLQEKETLIAKALKNNGSVIISGSNKMQKGVINTLENISLSTLKRPLNMELIQTEDY